MYSLYTDDGNLRLLTVKICDSQCDLLSTPGSRVILVSCLALGGPQQVYGNSMPGIRKSLVGNGNVMDDLINESLNGNGCEAGETNH